MVLPLPARIKFKPNTLSKQPAQSLDAHKPYQTVFIFHVYLNLAAVRFREDQPSHGPSAQVLPEINSLLKRQTELFVVVLYHVTETNVQESRILLETLLFFYVPSSLSLANDAAVSAACLCVAGLPCQHLKAKVISLNKPTPGRNDPQRSKKTGCSSYVLKQICVMCRVTNLWTQQLHLNRTAYQHVSTSCTFYFDH